MDIRIYPDGKIIVKAPLEADNSDIANFIREEENWIRVSYRELQKEADKNVQ
jgi:predicted metal-dependent hydrolase